jgi:hypothetical protein
MKCPACEKLKMDSKCYKRVGAKGRHPFEPDRIEIVYQTRCTNGHYGSIGIDGGYKLLFTMRYGEGWK